MPSVLATVHPKADKETTRGADQDELVQEIARADRFTAAQCEQSQRQEHQDRRNQQGVVARGRAPAKQSSYISHFTTHRVAAPTGWRYRVTSVI